MVSVGPDATRLKPGDLVFMDCFFRSRDDPATTQIMTGLASGPSPAQQKLMEIGWRDGLYKTFATVPLENAHYLDEDALAGRLGYSPPDLAISLNRLAVAYGGASAVNLKPGQTVICAPATGQFTGALAELLTALGARVIALGRNAEKLEAVTNAISATYPSSPSVEGVVITGDAAVDEASIRTLLPAGSPGVDAFIDMSPGMQASPPHIPVAIRCLRPGGKVALMGAVMADLAANYVDLMFRNITIKGQWMYTKQELSELLRMVEMGVVKVGQRAGHEVVGEYALEEWEVAMRDVEESDAWGKGVVFVPRDE